MEAGHKRMAESFQLARPLKILINVGACLDIVTGNYIKGKHGESILNGGLPNLTGVFGVGNNFKSTCMHYMLSAAQGRMMGGYALTYDTEMNIHEWHLSSLVMSAQEQLGLPVIDILQNGDWAITDKSQYSGNKWFSVMRDYLKEKATSKEKTWKATTPFLDRNGKNLEIKFPSFVEIDSFSEISTDAIEKMQDKAEIGESGQNAVSLKQGQHKNQMLMELPGLAAASDAYFFLSAHMGETYALDPSKPPSKKLADVPADKKIKGVPEKFTFVMQNCWWCKSTTILLNQGTKEPEYPRDGDDNKLRDTDLKLVTLVQVRGKGGPTGIQVELVVSQTMGILPSLTEFHYIKERSRFGITGTLQSYSLDLLPDVKLNRKSVRGIIDGNDKLKRALNITSELCQMHEYWFHRKEVMITPLELYTRIKEAGYDWDMILTQTRGYWVLEEDTRPLGLFLSTMDLINMVTPDKNGKLYHPYWLEADKKTIKKQYLPYLKTQKEKS